MAFTSDERAQLLSHLRMLRVLSPSTWVDTPTPEAALDAATADQETAARAELTTLARLKSGLASMDSRLSVKEIDEVVLRENEHDLRVQHYLTQLQALGLIFGLCDPAGSAYAISSETQRSVL